MSCKDAQIKPACINTPAGPVSGFVSMQVIPGINGNSLVIQYFDSAGQIIPDATDVCPDEALSVPTVLKSDSLDYIPTGYITKDTCMPVVAQVQCLNGEIIKPFPLGTLNDKGEFIMTIEITPAGTAMPSCETVDIVPLLIPAGTAPATYSALLTAALAAAPANYPTFGPASDADTIMSVQATPQDEGGNLLFNGLEVGGINDPDGVNLDMTIGSLDCDVVVSFCVQKCLSKADIAAL